MHPDFPKIVAKQSITNSIIKVNKDQATENVFAPAFSADLPPSVIDEVHHLEDLEAATMEELAQSLKSEIVLLTHSGTRNSPRMSPIVPYILTAADWVFSNRVPDIEQIYPLNIATTLVGNPGEFRAKMELISSSDYSVGKSIEKRDRGRALLMRANFEFVALVASILEADYCMPLLKHGDTLEIPLTWTGQPQGQGSVQLRIHDRFYYGPARDWRIRVLVDGKTEWTSSILELRDLLVQRVNSTTHIAITAEYVGKSRLIPREHAFSAEGSARFQKSLILANRNSPRVLTLQS